MMNSDNAYERALAFGSVGMAAKAAGWSEATANAFSNMGQVATKEGNYNTTLFGSANATARTPAAVLVAQAGEKIESDTAKVDQSREFNATEAQVRIGDAAAASDPKKVAAAIRKGHEKDKADVKGAGEAGIKNRKEEGQGMLGKQIDGAFKNAPAAHVAGKLMGAVDTANYITQNLKEVSQGNLSGAAASTRKAIQSFEKTFIKQSFEETIQERAKKSVGIDSGSQKVPPKPQDKK